MHSTGQGYPQKKVKNKDDTHSTRKNYVFMTDYGTSDKITYGNIVYKLKKNVSLWHHNDIYYETTDRI